MDAESLQQLVSEVAVRELGEDERTREHALTQMRDWVSSHPNIRNCRTDDSFLLRFLRAKKFNIPKAQQMLENFLDLRNIFPPNLVCDLDVATPSINELVSSGFYFVSPYRDDAGRQVVMIIFGKLDSKKYTYEAPTRAMQISNYALMENDVSQVLGYTFIFDAAKFSLGHLGMWPSPIEFIRFLKSGEASVPMRCKEIHILNLPPFATWVFNLLKAVMTKKIQRRLMIHGSLKGLHKKVNPRVLPTEYGGTTSMEEMTNLWREELTNKRDVILGLDNMKLLRDRDNKRGQSNIDASLVTSFRNLQVD